MAVIDINDRIETENDWMRTGACKGLTHLFFPSAAERPRPCDAMTIVELGEAVTASSIADATVPSLMSTSTLNSTPDMSICATPSSSRVWAFAVSISEKTTSTMWMLDVVRRASESATSTALQDESDPSTGTMRR